MNIEEGIDRSNSSKDKAAVYEAYSTPVVRCYGDIRDITLGGSVRPGESGPFNRADGDESFEGSLFEERGSIGGSGSGSGSGDSGGRTGRN